MVALSEADVFIMDIRPNISTKRFYSSTNLGTTPGGTGSGWHLSFGIGNNREYVT
jgi:hypothetical protein